MNINPIKTEDLPALKLALDRTELFPGEMFPHMVSGFLSNNESEDLWLTCEADGTAIDFCCATPEALTEGTWNMLAIAVLPKKQGSGAGSAIVKQLESNLLESGHRVL